MADLAVDVQHLSKRYWLGEHQPGQTLQEAVLRAVGRLRGAKPAPPQEIWSLRDVSFDVPEGDAVGVIGRNGAGKTTLLKVLSRITEPTEGVSRTRGRVAALLEVGTGFHPELTGRENVYLNGAILGMSRRSIDRTLGEIVEFAGVDRFIDTPVKRYSSGMYLRLAFSVAAHLEPDIMVVDEVLAVGDAEFQSRCLRRMETAEREGRTVLFVSHNLDAITRLCPRAIWLERGAIAGDGPAAQIVDDYLSSQTVASGRDDGASAIASRGPVTLRAVRTTDETGRPLDTFRRVDPLVIEIRIALTDTVPGLDVAAYVLNSRGAEIVNESWSDSAPQRGDLTAGEHVLRVHLPPVLNVGEYVVGVWVGTTYETFFQELAARRFTLVGDDHDRPKRAVVLAAPWSVESLPGS